MLSFMSIYFHSSHLILSHILLLLTLILVILNLLFLFLWIMMLHHPKFCPTSPLIKLFNHLLSAKILLIQILHTCQLQIIHPNQLSLLLLVLVLSQFCLVLYLLLALYQLLPYLLENHLDLDMPHLIFKTIIVI